MVEKQHLKKPDIWNLYSQMYGSRLFESLVNTLWYDGKISGEMHTSIGEEGIAAGILAHIKEGDACALDHRGTAYCVVRGVDRQELLLEMLGHEKGLCRGMGGHMHLFSKKHLIASNGIVGAAGPAAVGFALARKFKKTDNLAIAFFGEGAMNQGMLMESFNLARVWNLPVLFICKDNKWAITTESHTVTAGSILRRAASFGMPVVSLDGKNVETIWHESGNIIAEIRKTSLPAFIHINCFRPQGHFLNDPLISSVRNVKDTLLPMTFKLVQAGSKGICRTPAESIKGLLHIIKIIAKTIAEQVYSPVDPAGALRKKLVKENKKRLDDTEAAAVKEVDRVLSSVDQVLREGII